MAFLGAGDTFGRYEIVRRIGRGGMGSVFEARQTDLGRAVALKVLSPELVEDPAFRARFEREARTLALLDSPHVIQVYDAGEHEGDLYIATQLVHGRDLLQLLRQDGPPAPAVALRLVGQVASALADAHDAGLLHRDVKPSNVLVRETRSEPFAYLCDFGIARHAEAAHTRTRGVIGTLGYLAPECHDGADASVASDVYSLGCVLWAALTGRAPYERTSEFQVALAHLQEEIPTYAGGSAAEAEINAILLRAMAKDPAARFATAGEMHTALLDAEEVARGLRRSGGEATSLRPSAPDPEATQVRVVPAGPGARAGTPGKTPSGMRRRLRPLAVAAAALLVVLGLAGTAMALLGGPGKAEETPRAAADATAPSRTPSPAQESPKARTTTSTAGKAAKKRVERTRARSATAPATTPAPSAPAPSAPVPTPEPADAAATVVCWDGSSEAEARACPLPAGRDGLATVFPSMDGTCATGSYKNVPGKAEVYECKYGRYMIRYSRWVRGADRYGYLDTENGVSGAQWSPNGEFAGRQWWSREDSPSESKQYQWSAAYRYWPYSVSVEGVDDAARAEGVRRVVVTASDRVALR